MDAVLKILQIQATVLFFAVAVLQVRVLLHSKPDENLNTKIAFFVYNLSLLLHMVVWTFWSSSTTQIISAIFLNVVATIGVLTYTDFWVYKKGT